MTTFNRTLLAEDGIAKVHTEALGDNTGQYGSKHIGRLVKMTANSYVEVSAGNDIEGQVTVVQAATVNDGFSHGSVKKSHRIKVLLGADAGSNSVAVGDLVVADAQPTFADGGMGHVKKGTPTLHNWQVIWLSGAGGAGDEAILERV